jgi:hypothetical protein
VNLQIISCNNCLIICTVSTELHCCQWANRRVRIRSDSQCLNNSFPAGHDSHTFPSLWRTYSSLDPLITSTGATLLPPPSRLCFPHIYTFVEPPSEEEFVPLTRSHVGFHPNLLKTVFPSMGVMYAEDWQDLDELEVPFIMERAVIADREASRRAMSRQGNEAYDWTAPFLKIDASRNWWEPVRTSLTRNLHIDDESSDVVITYITRQDEESGPRLRDRDHTTLVQELQRLEKESKYTVNIVSNSTRWEDMMTMILKSTVWHNDLRFESRH